MIGMVQICSDSVSPLLVKNQRTIIYPDVLNKHRDYITPVVACLDGELYSATVADISSRDALIYSKPIRSEQHDSQWLNGIVQQCCFT